MMDQETISIDKMIEVYKTVCEVNDKLILSGEKIQASCIIFQGEEQKVYTFDITTKTQKTIADSLKRKILLSGAKGYILILDTYTAKQDKKKSVGIVGACIKRTLYTSQKVITEFVWYNDKEILGKDLIMERTLYYDQFDAWNEGSLEVSKKRQSLDVKDLFKGFNIGGQDDKDM